MLLDCFPQQFCILSWSRPILVLSSSENEASSKMFEEGEMQSKVLAAGSEQKRRGGGGEGAYHLLCHNEHRM